MKRIYVAGGSHELALVKGYMARLRAAGFEITHDWTAVVEAAIAAGLTANPLDKATALRAANADLKGIEDAEIFWLITPVAGSVGAFFELGYAMGSGLVRLIVVSSPYRSIFQVAATDLSDSDIFETHESAFDSLVQRFGKVAR